jgi:hypothetical protein
MLLWLQVRYPRAYARHRTAVAIIFRLHSMLSFWLMLIFVSSNAAAFKTAREEMFLGDDGTGHGLQQLLLPTGILPLLVQGFGSQFALPLQLLLQLLSVAFTVHGLLLILFRSMHLQSFYSLISVHESVRSLLLPSITQKYLSRLLPSACSSVGVGADPSHSEPTASFSGSQQQLEPVMASCQLLLFLGLAVGYIVPMYVAYMQELRSKLVWLDSRGLMRSGWRSTDNGSGSRQACPTPGLTFREQLQLVLAGRRWRWWAVLLHAALLHASAVLVWLLSCALAGPAVRLWLAASHAALHMEQDVC